MSLASTPSRVDGWDERVVSPAEWRHPRLLPDQPLPRTEALPQLEQLGERPVHLGVVRPEGVPPVPVVDDSEGVPEERREGHPTPPPLFDTDCRRWKSVYVSGVGSRGARWPGQVVEDPGSAQDLYTRRGTRRSVPGPLPRFDGRTQGVSSVSRQRIVRFRNEGTELGPRQGMCVGLPGTQGPLPLPLQGGGPDRVAGGHLLMHREPQDVVAEHLKTLHDQ